MDASLYHRQKLAADLSKVIVNYIIYAHSIDLLQTAFQQHGYDITANLLEVVRHRLLKEGVTPKSMEDEKTFLDDPPVWALSLVRYSCNSRALL